MDKDKLKEIEAKHMWDWVYDDILWLIAELKQSRSNEEAITRSREGYAQQNEALAEELEKCEAEIKRLKK